jgi:transcription elongation factor Elf1
MCPNCGSQDLTTISFKPNEATYECQSCKKQFDICATPESEMRSIYDENCDDGGTAATH